MWLIVALKKTKTTLNTQIQKSGNAGMIAAQRPATLMSLLHAFTSTSICSSFLFACYFALKCVFEDRLLNLHLTFSLCPINSREDNIFWILCSGHKIP